MIWTKLLSWAAAAGALLTAVLAVLARERKIGRDQAHTQQMEETHAARDAADAKVADRRGTPLPDRLRRSDF